MASQLTTVESTSEKVTRELAEVTHALERLRRLAGARRAQPAKLEFMSGGDRDSYWLVPGGYTDDQGDPQTLNFFEDRSAAESYLVLHAMLAPSIALLEEAAQTLRRLHYTTKDVMALARSVNGASGEPEA